MKYPKILCFLSTLLLPFSMVAEQPLVTVDLQSYRAVLDDAARISAAVAPDQAIELETMIQGMVGAEAIALIDQSKPWHLALWMDQMGQPPTGALYLPVSDMEAFEAAISQGFLATQSLSVASSGDFVILTQYQAANANFDQRAAEYVKQLPSDLPETISVQLNMNEPVRAMALGGLQMSKGMMLSTMQAADAPEMGLPANFYESIFGAYFGAIEYIVRDLSTLNLSLSADSENLKYKFSIHPKEDSPLADWMDRQNIEITDIATSVDWSAPMAVAASMAPLSASERATWSNLLEMMMPLYGLEAKDAEQWMQLVDMTLPLKTGYSMELADTFSFEGFYQILNGSADKVYEQSIQLISLMPTAEDGPMAYYTAVEFQKDIREVNGQSIDQMSMVLNLDHPTMQMPGQKEQMLALFKDGRITYEFTTTGDHIYFATAGNIEQALEENNSSPAIRPNSATRMLGSFNIISLMQFGAKSAPAVMPMMSDLNDEAGSLWFMVNVSDSLEMQTILPLNLLKEFSKLQ